MGATKRTNKVINKAIKLADPTVQPVEYTKFAILKADGDPTGGTYRCTIGTATEMKVRGEYSLLTTLTLGNILQPQPHCSTVNVNGPYRQCPDSFTLCGTKYTEAINGFDFTSTQKKTIKKANWAKNGKLKSDLAGYRYTYNGVSYVEPEFLDESPNKNANSPEIHHVLPKKDRQGCNCGSNSMKNAAVISHRLNQYFLNNKRETAEVQMINSKEPYPCPAFIPAPSPSSSNTRSEIRAKIKKR